MSKVTIEFETRQEANAFAIWIGKEGGLELFKKSRVASFVPRIDDIEEIVFEGKLLHPKKITKEDFNNFVNKK